MTSVISQVVCAVRGCGEKITALRALAEDTPVTGGDAPGNSEICVVDLTSGEIRRLTQDPGYDAEPVWSPGPP